MQDLFTEKQINSAIKKLVKARDAALFGIEAVKLDHVLNQELRNHIHAFYGRKIEILDAKLTVAEYWQDMQNAVNTTAGE